MPIQLPDEKNSEPFELVSIWGECGEFNVPGSVWLTMLDVALAGVTTAATILQTGKPRGACRACKKARPCIGVATPGQ
jgi:hypothetical protein